MPGEVVADVRDWSIYVYPDMLDGADMTDGSGAFCACQNGARREDWPQVCHLVAHMERKWLDALLQTVFEL